MAVSEKYAVALRNRCAEVLRQRDLHFVPITSSAQSTPNGTLTRDLLVWIQGSPRSYRETMEAWQTSCPRLSIWEDAVSDGLVQIRASTVRLTPRGETALVEPS